MQSGTLKALRRNAKDFDLYMAGIAITNYPADEDIYFIMHRFCTFLLILLHRHWAQILLSFSVLHLDNL